MASKKKQPANQNPNTLKSRERYELLERIAHQMFPDKEKASGSNILTAFTSPLYRETPTPMDLTDDQIQQSVRQTLQDLLAALDA